MATQSVWVPGYVAAAQKIGGGGIGSSEGPLKNYDGGPLGFVPQHDYQDVVGFRQQWGVKFRGRTGQKVSFHFAIPTPFVLEAVVDMPVNSKPSQATRVYVLWRTSDNARVLEVHAQDGARAELHHWPLNPIPMDPMELPGLSGIVDGSPDQPGGDPKLLDGWNAFKLDPPMPVFYGLGITVDVQFDLVSDDSEVIFTSAGADFVTGP